MIYRLLVDRPDDAAAPLTLPAPEIERRRLGGACVAGLGAVMDACGLRAPQTIDNCRCRFYFTEAGWLTVGRHVAAEATRLGHVVRVISRKNPSPPQIVFEDRLQLALLPQGRSKAR